MNKNNAVKHRENINADRLFKLEAYKPLVQYLIDTISKRLSTYYSMLLYDLKSNTITKNDRDNIIEELNNEFMCSNSLTTSIIKYLYYYLLEGCYTEDNETKLDDILKKSSIAFPIMKYIYIRISYIKMCCQLLSDQMHLMGINGSDIIHQEKESDIDMDRMICDVVKFSNITSCGDYDTSPEMDATAYTIISSIKYEYKRIVNAIK